MNKYTLSYRFLNGYVHGCVFAKNRPVSLNWSDYTYSVIDLGLKIFFTVIWNLQAFYSLQIEDYPLKTACCVQCYCVLYFPSAYYSVYGVNSYSRLNRGDYLYLKVVDLVICLA